MKTFTLLSSKDFTAKARTLGDARKEVVATIQELAINAIYMQAFTQKADHANNLINAVTKHTKRDADHVKDFLNAHCENLRTADKNDVDTTKAFFVKKGTKPHTDNVAASEAGKLAITDLPNWDTWAKVKAETEKVVKPYDFLKAFTTILDKAKNGIIIAEQSAQLHALTSFTELILAGKSLADIKTDHALQLAGAKLDAITEVNKPTKKQAIAA